MVTHIPRASVNTPVNTVIESLRGQNFECADTVFVIDAEGRLEGAFVMERAGALAETAGDTLLWMGQDHLQRRNHLSTSSRIAHNICGRSRACQSAP